MEILYTKLYTPSPGTDKVERVRLIDRLNKGLTRKLTLISAPAGSGKTTLLSEWVHRTDRKVAWYSLDQDDNNPIRFWRYIIAAFMKIDGSIGQISQTAFDSTRISSLTDAVGIFINEISTQSQDYILVLDDYQSIKAESIHESLNYFLDYLPPHVHIVIATREDPPLLLAKRRGGSEINEIRIKDLSFTLHETENFLNKIQRLHLLPHAIQALERKTEGWIAGLKMAALSLKQYQKEDHYSIIKYFTSDDRYIVDYLVEEIIKHQDKDIQQFLLETSILERFNGMLCHAVTGRKDAQKILGFLEKINLFIVPLDNQCYWYRYHHLFAELLKKQLCMQKDKEYITGLYEKAYIWCIQNDLILEAINYAFAASHYDFAVALLEQHILTLFFRSEIALINNWLKLLPDTILHNYSLLLAVYACTEVLLSGYSKETIKQAELWIDKAEKILLAGDRYKKGTTSKPSFNDVSGFISNFRGYLSRFRGDSPQKVISITQTALNNLPGESIEYRAALYTNLGYAYENMADDEKAIDAFTKAGCFAKKSEDVFNLAAASSFQAILLNRRGLLKQAVSVCEECLELISLYSGKKKSIRMVPYSAVVLISLAEIVLESNNQKEAERLITKALSYIEPISHFTSVVNGYIVYARLHYSKGNVTEAFHVLEKATQMYPDFTSHIDTWACRFYLMESIKDPGSIEYAIKWAESNKSIITKKNYIDYTHYLIQYTYFRYLITRKRIDKSFDISDLDECINVHLTHVRNKKWVRWEIELLILYSLFLDVQGKKESAVNVLKKALIISKSEGYIRLFLDEGIPMKNLLQHPFVNEGALIFTHKLIQAFQNSEGIHTNLLNKDPILMPPRDIDNLTSREIEVLKLVAIGKTNPMIAEQLFVSVDTIKKHLTHIYSKLGVKNRTQAATYIKSSGLLR